MSNFWPSIPSMSDLVYLLEFLLNGEKRWVLLQPVDAANGVILDDRDDNGIMHGLTLGGRAIEIPFTHVLKVDPQYKVTRFNGQTHRSERVSAEKLEKIIDRNTDKKTGEVTGIDSIEEVGNSDNRVTRKREPEGGW